MNKINFKIQAIDYKQFNHLFELTATELIKFNAKKILVDEEPGFPCRVSLEEAEIGETIIAIPFKHHEVQSPYKASGPIFVRKNVNKAQLEVNEIPGILQHRFLSIRAYDAQSMMIDATTSQGKDIQQVIQTLFLNINVQYLHIHNANPGCYNCCVDRVK